MAAASSTRSVVRRFWRYNYQILVGAGYWIVVLPVAASVLVSLWMMPLQGDFKQTTADAIAELLTPILGAFLAAHSLAPEYRSGIGAVLACKPIPLGRVVALRVALAMLAAIVLATTVNALCSFALSPVDIWAPLLASLPSLWFLSMLALTFATLFRNALAGFGMAASIWVLDLAVGYSVHPFLSLQGLRAVHDQDPLAGLWLYGKATLVILGFALLWLQGRLLHRVTRPPERADIRRMLLAAAAVVLVYCATGAATMVTYAYAHRCRLPSPDVLWLRRQLAAYGPVRIAPMFGPAFAAYVDSPLPLRGEVSAVSARLRELEQATRRWPGSIWAPAIAFELAAERERAQRLASAADFVVVADRFGSSPFAAKALAELIRSKSPQVTDEDRLRAARRLVSQYPKAPEGERGADALLDRYPAEVGADEMAAAAEVGASSGPRFRRPNWLMTLAQVQASQGKAAKAVATATEARQAAQELLDEDKVTPSGMISIIGPHRAHLAQAVTAANTLIDNGGQPEPQPGPGAGSQGPPGQPPLNGAGGG